MRRAGSTRAYRAARVPTRGDSVPSCLRREKKREGAEKSSRVGTKRLIRPPTHPDTQLRHSSRSSQMTSLLTSRHHTSSVNRSTTTNGGEKENCKIKCRRRGWSRSCSRHRSRRCRRCRRRFGRSHSLRRREWWCGREWARCWWVRQPLARRQRTWQLRARRQRARRRRARHR